MGIEHNAKLVPVVVLGEVNALQNPIDLPELQRWTYKNLGFPVPYWVVGRWGVSPFPKRAGLKFIIGEPICPRPHVPGTKVMGDAWFYAQLGPWNRHAAAWEMLLRYLVFTEVLFCFQGVYALPSIF